MITAQNNSKTKRHFKGKKLHRSTRRRYSSTSTFAKLYPGRRAREQKRNLGSIPGYEKGLRSVNIEMLQLALERIKIPEVAVKFILNLYKNREIEVITSIGNTEKFVAGDGIDQEEVISLLIWKIFYDSLLVEIQEEK